MTEIALYHEVRPYEGFEEAARHIFAIVQKAAADFPGQQRVLFLDIEGHRNTKGGFDHDMFELQTSFILTFLMPYLTKAVLPLVSAANREQRDDLPERLEVAT